MMVIIGFGIWTAFLTISLRVAEHGIRDLRPLPGPAPVTGVIFDPPDSLGVILFGRAYDAGIYLDVGRSDKLKELIANLSNRIRQGVVSSMRAFRSIFMERGREGRGVVRNYAFHHWRHGWPDNSGSGRGIPWRMCQPCVGRYGASS